MGFGSNCYARVWSVEDKGKYAVAEISVSKKHNEGDYVVGTLSNGYDVQFQSKFVRLVGHAYNKGKNLERGTTIILRNIDETNKVIKEKISLTDEEIEAVAKNAGVPATTVIKVITAIGEKKYREVTNRTIFDFDFPDDNGNASTTKKYSAPDVIADDDKLPFEFD